MPLSGADITSDRTLAAALRRSAGSSARTTAGMHANSAAKIRFNRGTPCKYLDTANWHIHYVIHPNRLFHNKGLSVFYADKIPIEPSHRSQAFRGFLVRWKEVGSLLPIAVLGDVAQQRIHSSLELPRDIGHER